jgi:hypothetical protein
MMMMMMMMMMATTTTTTTTNYLYVYCEEHGKRNVRLDVQQKHLDLLCFFYVFVCYDKDYLEIRVFYYRMSFGY